MSNYKKIQDFDYAVDCNGNIKSLKTNKNLSLVTNNKRKPYKRVGLTKNGKRYFFLVHRLVAEAFILNPNNKPFINHINENKSDNNINNLEWVTNQENIRHSNLKKIKQIDLQGNLIKVWNALFEIKDSKLFNISKVSECCNKKRKMAYNYKWEYVNTNNCN